MFALPSSSSSLIRKRQRELSYDIFLSFNGKDSRKGFTDHLLSALTGQVINTFRDDKSLDRGEDFAPELFRAIRDSWGSIIVISEGCASSRWCLDELVEIMKQRKERGHRVYPIFYHVDPSDFRHQINRVKEAFDKHEKRYNEKTTQRWRVALQEVTAINGWPLKDQYESVFIEDIVNNISKKFDTEVLDEQEVERMKKSFRIIQALLVDAENKLYMKGGEAMKVWLDELKHIAYDMDDVLDKWNTAILKSKIEKDQGQTHSISSSHQSVVCNISLRIKKLNENYQAIVKKKDDFSFALDPNNICTDLTLERGKTVSFIGETDVHGRDRDKDALVSLLLRGGNGKGIPLLAIVGMGGIGKTTLAQLAYNNDEVKNHFHPRIWVCVSDPFNEVSIAKAILGALNGTSSRFDELERLLQEIHQRIARKKFLLVLDDVWNEDEQKWQGLKSCLQSGSQGSKILVTTRKENVGTIMGCTDHFLNLGKLSEDECWSLFSQIALSGRNNRERKNLEDIGKKIADRCDGLPLAAKTLGGLLRFKNSKEQWQRVLDSHLWELDEVEKGIFSPLLLSYYDLPSPLRQCFSYCAIFPKDYIIEKDLLIKLWMAQGFLREGREMEIVGEEYFDNLAARSFFQEFGKDKDDDSIIVRCKMHDILHDFAQLLRKTEFCVIASNGIEEQRAEFCHEDVRHLTFVCGNEDDGIPDLTYNVKKLRSFFQVGRWFRNTSGLEASLPKLFDQLTCLRMFNLSRDKSGGHSPIKKLPHEIGKLIHLRYLSLEGNVELYELPESICDLCNLQTLNIRRCVNFQALPRGMGKLINLRHLQNAYESHSLSRTRILMPRGMQRLTCLQTLEVCWVRKERDGIESETSFSLTGLGKLTHLRGKLRIYGLGEVGEASEAREARLSTKTGLCELTLNFFGGYYLNNEGSILEALQPPQNLQFLNIECCIGPAFPNWMASLTMLKRVMLSYCYNLENLPPMGKLPSLETLFIKWMNKVKKVGEEFVGVETSSSFVNHDIVAFPNLKTLKFSHMYQWEEWEYENVLKSRGGDHSYSSSNTITIMPKLQRLVIKDCPMLKMLPRHLLQSRALQEWEIAGCPILRRRYNKETGDDWPSISHIPSVETENRRYNSL